MKTLYFDCFSGASGDMILGALLDAGLPLEELRHALGTLGLEARSIEAARVDRAGVAATKVRVRTTESTGAAEGHEEVHEPHSHALHATHSHRTLAEIAALIERSALSDAAKSKAKNLFTRLGEVEAAIHQVPLDRVHLHEVGALDSIIDIVGAVHALECLAPDVIVASPLNVGGGTVRCAHGDYPVPAPATVRLLEGVPIYSSGSDGELVTPTGALLVTAYASSFGPLPLMSVERVGYGAGDRNPPGRPNVLRVLVGKTADEARVERVVLIQCEIDDMNPQIFGVLMDRLYEAGALDVFYVPVQMKKNRPGTLLTIVAPPGHREALSGIVFRESTTLGLRFHEVSRECLDREIVSIETRLGPVRVKIARRASAVVNVSPEFDDCARLATESRLSVKEVQALAMKAYLDIGTGSG